MKNDLRLLGKKNLLIILKDKTEIYNRKKGELNNLETDLKKLENIAINAEEKPLFPTNRSIDSFEVGEKIRIFTEEGNLVKAKVLPKNHDCFINYQITNPKKGKFDEGSVGIHRGDLLKENDFEYLLKHPNFFKIWCEKSGDLSYEFVDTIKNYKSNL